MSTLTVGRMPAEIWTFLREIVPDINPAQADKNIKRALDQIDASRQIGQPLGADEERLLLVMAMLADDKGRFEISDERLTELFNKLGPLATGLIDLNLH